MDEKKRKRSANFSPKEIHLLLDTLQQYSPVIENKKLDTTTWKTKEKAWIAITEQFNSKNVDLTRTVTTLKQKYEGLKKALRKKKISNKELGEDKKIPYSDYEEKLWSILQSSGQEGTQNDQDVVVVLSPKQETKIEVSDNEEFTFTEDKLVESDDGTEVSPMEDPFERFKILNTTTVPNCDASATASFDHQGLDEKDIFWNRTGIARKRKTTNDEENHTSLAKRKSELMKLQTEVAGKELELKIRQIEFVKRENERKEEEHRKKMELLDLQIVNLM